MNGSSRPVGNDTPPRHLRILHLFRAPIGGLFRHVCDLVREQARMGCHVGVICDSSTGGTASEAQLEQLAEHCRLGILRVPMSRHLSLHDVTAHLAIARHAAKLQPDILHGHGAKGGAYARLLRRNPHQIAVYTPHGGALHYAWSSSIGAVFLVLERMLRNRSDGIVFESAFSAAAYARKVGALGCPARIVPNGLTEADFAPLNGRDPDYDVVFVGELRALKGVAMLIEAAAILATQRELRVGIAGTGPDEALFRALAKTRGLEGRIDFLGHQSARAMFARGRVVAVPSLAESFPYVVLEAAASGRPVVATNVGGIPEIFGPLAGGLIPPGDASALAQAVAALLDHPAGTQGALELQQRVRGFSVAQMAAQITSFYGEILHRRENSGGFPATLNRPETSSI